MPLGMAGGVGIAGGAAVTRAMKNRVRVVAVWKCIFSDTSFSLRATCFGCSGDLDKGFGDDEWESCWTVASS